MEYRSRKRCGIIISLLGVMAVVLVITALVGFDVDVAYAAE